MSPPLLHPCLQVIVTDLLLPASATAVCLQVIVTDREWPQRQQFLDTLKAALQKLPSRVPYYPGSPQKYAEYVLLGGGRFPCTVKLCCCVRYN